MYEILSLALLIVWGKFKGLYNPGCTDSTSGFRMAYINKNGDIISIHRPHPGKIIEPATLKDVLIFLNEKGYVTKD